MPKSSHTSSWRCSMRLQTGCFRRTKGRVSPRTSTFSAAPRPLAWAQRCARRRTPSRAPVSSPAAAARRRDRSCCSLTKTAARRTRSFPASTGRRSPICSKPVDLAGVTINRTRAPGCGTDPMRSGTFREPRLPRPRRPPAGAGSQRHRQGKTGRRLVGHADVGRIRSCGGHRWRRTLRRSLRLLQLLPKTAAFYDDRRAAARRLLLTARRFDARPRRRSVRAYPRNAGALWSAPLPLRHSEYCSGCLAFIDRAPIRPLMSSAITQYISSRKFGAVLLM